MGINKDFRDYLKDKSKEVGAKAKKGIKEATVAGVALATLVSSLASCDKNALSPNDTTTPNETTAYAQTEDITTTLNTVDSETTPVDSVDSNSEYSRELLEEVLANNQEGFQLNGITIVSRSVDTKGDFWIEFKGATEDVLKCDISLDTYGKMYGMAKGASDGVHFLGYTIRRQDQFDGKWVEMYLIDIDNVGMANNVALMEEIYNQASVQPLSIATATQIGNQTPPETTAVDTSMEK